jgi:hypothetical protein
MDVGRDHLVHSQEEPWAFALREEDGHNASCEPNRQAVAHPVPFVTRRVSAPGVDARLVAKTESREGHLDGTQDWLQARKFPLTVEPRGGNVRERGKEREMERNG